MRMICYILFSILLLAVAARLHYSSIQMDWKDVIVCLAIIVGPISAVVITRILDDKIFPKERKLPIFRSLVKDRSNPLSFESVQAFNLIQIEFPDSKEVVNAWKKSLGEPFSNWAIQR